MSRASNQIQRDLEQQISALQAKTGNATIKTKNVAIQVVKVPKESVVSRNLVFEAILKRQNQSNILDTTVKTGEPPKEEAEVAISFQLSIDIISDVHNGMYVTSIW